MTRKVIWSDLKYVLHWLHTSKLLLLFVENRLKEIRKATDKQIRYVSTADNPVDVATQGCTLKELAVNQLRWHRPFWLNQTEEYWPQDIEHN